MEFAVGIGLAFGVAIFGAVGGFDRDRAFYATVLVVVASYYDLFAVIGEHQSALGPETVGLTAFASLSIVGFRTNLWIVAFALAGHGMFDFVHGQFIENSGVPTWWPAFCGSFDVAAAVFLAWRLITGKVEAESPASFTARIRHYVDAELAAARLVEHDAAACFAHLERAHVLGQASTVHHVRVHLHMLAWSWRHRRPHEFFGQVTRVVGATVATPIGMIPIGNTGGANVSPFKSMAIPRDLDAFIAAARGRAVVESASA